MPEPTVFKFAMELDSYQAPDAWVVKMPTSITTKSDLLEAFYEKFKFPEYFGFNWDALFDCLRDLSWIKEYLVVIIHRDLPLLSLDEMRKYFFLLSDAITTWGPDDDHQLEVVFHESLKEKVIDIFKT